MSVFALILQAEDPEITKRIRDNFQKHHQVSPTVFVVVSEDLSEKVAISAGIKGEDRASETGGVVFKLHSSYSGYAHPSIWEWLEDNQGHFG